MVFDGLDESSIEEQKELVAVLRQLTTGTDDCKAAVFSRDLPNIRQSLKSFGEVSLKDEAGFVEQSIKAFVQHEITALRDGLDEEEQEPETFDRIQKRILQKAGGKIWVGSIVQKSY